jgi:hypothetical protein
MRVIGRLVEAALTITYLLGVMTSFLRRSKRKPRRLGARTFPESAQLGWDGSVRMTVPSDSSHVVNRPSPGRRRRPMSEQQRQARRRLARLSRSRRV